MKRLFLFISMAVLAITSFGQTVKNPNVKVWAAPTCTDNASKPSTGNEYTYTVTIPNTSGFTGTGTYDWYVTQTPDLLVETDFKTAGTEFTVAASGSSTYHSSTSTSANIKITWTAAALETAKPYFLVVKYSEVASTCTASNIKVYKVEPQNTFWLDINPTKSDFVVGDATAYGEASSFDICAADVKSAVVTDGATPTIEYTFNDNTLYAVIHAAGYTGDWTPTLKISGLFDDQAVSSITWDAGATTGTFTGATGNGTYTSTTKLPSTYAGTDIKVVITIANNHHEGLADLPVKISIDGTYGTATATYNDKSDQGAGCSDEAADADYVVETIKARPTVTPSVPATFISAPTILP